MSSENKGICRIYPDIRNSVRSLCFNPYPGHPNGCPNYGKKEGCPPAAPLFYDFFRGEVTMIWNRFHIGEHARRMKKLHPEWSDKQAYCCLYWQGKARKQLQIIVDDFICSTTWMDGQLTPTYCPEAMGVNVTATMEMAGIFLEWPPREYAYQVAFVGVVRNV